MRGRYVHKLRRDATERRHLWRNQVTSLIKHERIKTTLPKAQALVRLVDDMITHAKRGTLADYRRASAFIQEPAMVRKAFTELADRYKFRPGGYTRIIRTFNRRVDHAPMAYIEFVDRVGELRPPRPVSYLSALQQKLVPEPLSPIVTARDLHVASMISPSTSNRVALHRPHFRRLQPDHLTYYPDFTRRKTNIPAYLRDYQRNRAAINRLQEKHAARKAASAAADVIAPESQAAAVQEAKQQATDALV